MVTLRHWSFAYFVGGFELITMLNVYFVLNFRQKDDGVQMPNFWQTDSKV